VKRILMLSGTLLLVLPPLTVLALRRIPFDFAVVLPVPLPSATALMLSGGFLILAGLLRRHP
jgi:hypothetical protein